MPALKTGFLPLNFAIDFTMLLAVGLVVQIFATKRKHSDDIKAL
jgi:hypothetical protein